MKASYSTVEEVLETALAVVGKSLSDCIPQEELPGILNDLRNYGTRRKGFFGDLVERFVFGFENNSRAEADFAKAGVELKTTPLVRKGKAGELRAKERLVFSMIDYCTIVNEKWENSSFLKKNSLVLLMFYLYLERLEIVDYEFKFVFLLNLLGSLAPEDTAQIRSDWEFIARKIRNGQAHLLSEGDTYFLGACTKAATGMSVRRQPNSSELAKPRAFALKQKYLNHLICNRSHLQSGKRLKALIRNGVTIEVAVARAFNSYRGKSFDDIQKKIGPRIDPDVKQRNRILVERMLGGKNSGLMQLLEKADVTLRVVVLEPSEALVESISFEAFSYEDLIGQNWYEPSNEERPLADFHAQLDKKRFLFVVFQKPEPKSKNPVFKRFRFWNFPAEDLDEAKRVFELTKSCILEGRYVDLPKISESDVAHVRPHGRNAKDVYPTPQGGSEVKRCFWLNAKYIEKFLKE